MIIILNRKSILMGAAVLTIVGATGVVTFTTPSALAQSSYMHINMIQKLSQKLGVSEDKVKIVMDEMYAERRIEMKANIESKLSTLVTEGKITEAQKTAIIAKMDELHAEKEANRESMKNLTPEERRAQMQTKKTELETWAKSQGIDLSLIHFSKGMKGHR